MSHSVTYSTIVGQVLAKYRQDWGLEQVEMAKKTGISQSTWSRIERGEAIITLEQLNQIAASLKIPLESIMKDITRAQEIVEKEGIKIEDRSASKKVKTGVAIAAIALPALAYFVSKALSNKDDKS